MHNSWRLWGSVRRPWGSVRRLCGSVLLVGSVASCEKPPPCGLGSDVDVQASVWYSDDDEDGFGDPNDAVVACESVGGRVDNAEDCSDIRPDIHPGAEDALCDGVDSDCDGQVDEDGIKSWYFDADGDGAGGSISFDACEMPEGFVTASNDCDDDDAETYPGAVELCDGRDNNCDDDVGEGITARCYRDLDRDGRGDEDPDALRVVCGGGCEFEEATAADDCDDQDPLTWRGAPESCDGKDNDCEAGTWADEGAECGTGTSPTIDPASGHVYLVIPSLLSWSAASNTCAARGYHLAWLDDGVESAFVQAIFNQQTDLDSVWIGLRWNACVEDGTFQRVDGRENPWACSPMSAWEATALADEEDINSVQLYSGGLFAANGSGVFTGAVCEVEP